MPNDTPVQLLWTSGWDSTFQLLRLLLEHRVPVQPTYALDTTRPSAPVEIAAMDRIRAALAQAHPHTAELLHPTRYVRVEELAPDPGIDAAFDRILRKHRIGDQYAWLARFCDQRGLPDVELSIEKTAHAREAIQDEVVATQSPHGYPTHRVAPDCRDADIVRVFGRFSFPVFDLTKQDMAGIIERNGWGEYMRMTWFCHRPGKDGQPCGICNPCVYLIEHGMGWRIPRRRRVLSAVYRYTLAPMRSRARQWLRRFRPVRAT